MTLAEHIATVNKLKEPWTRELTDADRTAIEDYDAKIAEIRDWVLALIKGSQTGLMLFGRGGNGKSYSIRQTFQAEGIREYRPGDDDQDAPGYDTYAEHQGRVTAKGLVRQLADAPKSIHLIEDAETLFDIKEVWGVLRSALHSQDHQRHSRRHVQWKIATGKGSYDFDFTGTIIIVGNRSLPNNNPLVDAVKTRCACLDFPVSDAEMIGKMKAICALGYNDVTPTECFGVLEFYLSMRKNPLDFRTLVNGFKLRSFAKDSKVSWRDMLLSQMVEKVTGNKLSRAERVAQESQVARELGAKRWASQHDKIVEYCTRVGRSILWASESRDSEAYKTGYNAARTDFNRKNK